tara:strand:- start:131 stop:439 length:309 start_codon:yes stop_codon:yes gene_type:complete
MPRCNFCKKVYEFPRGLTYVLNDGNILHFCSGKCQKNNKLKRDPKKVNWVKRIKKGEKEKVEASDEREENQEESKEDKKQDKKESKKEEKSDKKEKADDKKE